MIRISELNEELVVRAEEELNKISGDKIVIRLKSIVALKNNSLGTVCEVMGYSRNTIKSWVRSFSKYGVKGLEDKPKSGRATKLSTKQQQEVLELVKNYKEGWTLFRLQKEILVKFGIKINHMSIWRLLKKQGFSYITPRPRHYKQDENQVQEFKKKSGRAKKK